MTLRIKKRTARHLLRNIGGSWPVLEPSNFVVSMTIRPSGTLLIAAPVRAETGHDYVCSYTASDSLSTYRSKYSSSTSPRFVPILFPRIFFLFRQSHSSSFPLILISSVSKINVLPAGIGPTARSPYPSSGGIVSFRFSPTHMSSRPSSHLIGKTKTPR